MPTQQEPPSPGLVLVASKPCVEKQHGRAWQRYADAFARAGLEYELHITQHAGHAETLARELGPKARLLAAVGGDGTLGEVAQGLLALVPEQRPVLGLVPLGRGNDFYRSLGVPMTPETVARAISGRCTQALDLGRAWVATPGGRQVERWFVNLASIGFAADVSASVAHYGRNVGGTIPYVRGLVENLLRWVNREVEVAVDGARTAANVFTVNVANGGYYGGGMHAAPGARLDDGLLDVTIMRDLSLWDVIRYMPNNYSGRFEGIAKITQVRGRSIEISAPAPLQVQLDGDVIGVTPARFEVVPSALRLAVATPPHREGATERPGTSPSMD